MKRTIQKQNGGDRAADACFYGLVAFAVVLLAAIALSAIIL